MKKIYFRIIMFLIPLFVYWIFILGIKYNFDFSDVKINLYASFKRIEEFSNASLTDLLTSIKNGFNTLEFNFNFQYVEITSLTTFFENVGVWFNGVWSITFNFFNGFGIILKALVDYLVYLINLLFAIIEFILNPVSF